MELERGEQALLKIMRDHLDVTEQILGLLRESPELQNLLTSTTEIRKRVDDMLQ